MSEKINLGSYGVNEAIIIQFDNIPNPNKTNIHTKQFCDFAKRETGKNYQMQMNPRRGNYDIPDIFIVEDGNMSNQRRGYKAHAEIPNKFIIEKDFLNKDDDIFKKYINSLKK